MRLEVDLALVMAHRPRAPSTRSLARRAGPQLHEVAEAGLEDALERASAMARIDALW
jgi:hypothetical protein